MLPVILSCICFLQANTAAVDTNDEGFIENIEAIQHFEEVFESAAAFAGVVSEESSDSNRRWDEGEAGTAYQRNSRQVGYLRNPALSRILFREQNIRANGRYNHYRDRQESIRNLNRIRNEQRQVNNLMANIQTNQIPERGSVKSGKHHKDLKTKDFAS